MVSKKTIKPYAGCVNPDDFPEERLLRERLVLLKCVKSDTVTYMSGKSFYTEEGKYYTGILRYRNCPPILHNEATWLVQLTNEKGLEGSHFVAECFEIISDPCGILSSNLHWQRMILQWKKAREQLVDKSKNIVDDDYLRENHLALVKFVWNNDSKLFKSGKQYFALSYSPDGYAVIIDTYYGQRCTYYPSSAFDILSDPLDLLDFSATNYNENMRIAEEKHPEWFIEDKDSLRLPNGRTYENDLIYTAFSERLPKRLDPELREEILKILDDVLEEN